MSGRFKATKNPYPTNILRRGIQTREIKLGKNWIPDVSKLGQCRIFGREVGEGGEDLKKRAYSETTGLCFFELLHLTQHYFVLSFSLVSLIKYSVHLRETDLGNNVLGEMAAADILEALRARKTGRAFSVCVPLHLSMSTPSQMQRYLQLAPLFPLKSGLS